MFFFTLAKYKTKNDDFEQLKKNYFRFAFIAFIAFIGGLEFLTMKGTVLRWNACLRYPQVLGASTSVAYSGICEGRGGASPFGAKKTKTIDFNDPGGFK